MSDLSLIVHDINPEEGALVLFETPGPGVGVPHRWQVIKVVRNDRVATYKRDLGPTFLYGDHYTSIVGGEVDEATGRGRMWHTVAELQDMADELRNRDNKAWVEEHGYEMTTASGEDWVNAYHEEREQRARKASGILVVGPKGRT